MVKTHLHLVSDSTGETINSVTRACMVQFDVAEPVEHVWSLVRTKTQMEKVLMGVRENPGPVLFTMVNRELRDILIRGCRQYGVPSIPVLDPVIHALANYYNLEMSGKPGLQHALDTEYFNRIEAMNFTLNHDDGQLPQNLNSADIVIIGVSRTSKTPTSVYLANRGLKTANVPIVPGCPLPEELFNLDSPLVIGLTKDPQSLVLIRKSRLRLMTHEHDDETDYVDLETVTEEVKMARKLCNENRWPIIDVTRRSIEETAATIIKHYNRHFEERQAREFSS
ncbi:pyruvate, water dikinase regulatory protein [Kiloniella sp. b19]|uniref:pyruvate, water dikinase regulatory protein n=1 Tax=Kiloniella sp. GXU_MW_B19 TaxID=3141326 RepID=UPI0031D30E8D